MLCSTSKVFVKVILQFQEENNMNLAGVQQHDFKHAKSTASAGLIIQSILSQAIDSNKYALMTSST
jgi:hypothetical protein